MAAMVPCRYDRHGHTSPAARGWPPWCPADTIAMATRPLPLAAGRRGALQQGRPGE